VPPRLSISCFALRCRLLRSTNPPGSGVCSAIMTRSRYRIATNRPGASRVAATAVVLPDSGSHRQRFPGPCGSVADTSWTVFIWSLAWLAPAGAGHGGRAPCGGLGALSTRALSSRILARWWLDDVALMLRTSAIAWLVYGSSRRSPASICRQSSAVFIALLSFMMRRASPVVITPPLLRWHGLTSHGCGRLGRDPDRSIGPLKDRSQAIQPSCAKGAVRREAPAAELPDSPLDPAPAPTGFRRAAQRSRPSR
jgi:hypothetical protein